MRNMGNSFIFPIRKPLASLNQRATIRPYHNPWSWHSGRDWNWWWNSIVDRGKEQLSRYRQSVPWLKTPPSRCGRAYSGWAPMPPQPPPPPALHLPASCLTDALLHRHHTEKFSRLHTFLIFSETLQKKERCIRSFLDKQLLKQREVRIRWYSTEDEKIKNVSECWSP